MGMTETKMVDIGKFAWVITALEMISEGKDPNDSNEMTKRMIPFFNFLCDNPDVFDELVEDTWIGQALIDTRIES